MKRDVLKKFDGKRVIMYLHEFECVMGEEKGIFHTDNEDFFILERGNEIQRFSFDDIWLIKLHEQKKKDKNVE